MINWWELLLQLIKTSDSLLLQLNVFLRYHSHLKKFLVNIFELFEKVWDILYQLLDKQGSHRLRHTLEGLSHVPSLNADRFLAIAIHMVLVNAVVIKAFFRIVIIFIISLKSIFHFFLAPRSSRRNIVLNCFNRRWCRLHLLLYIPRA